MGKYTKTRTFEQLNDEEILQIVSIISKEFNVSISEKGSYNLYKELLKVKYRVLQEKGPRHETY